MKNRDDFILHWLKHFGVECMITNVQEQDCDENFFKIPMSNSTQNTNGKKKCTFQKLRKYQ